MKTAKNPYWLIRRTIKHGSILLLAGLFIFVSGCNINISDSRPERILITLDISGKVLQKTDREPVPEAVVKLQTFRFEGVFLLGQTRYFVKDTTLSDSLGYYHFSYQIHCDKDDERAGVLTVEKKDIPHRELYDTYFKCTGAAQYIEMEL